VNEYTRREEVRWTFISSLCLVLFIGPAVALLVGAKGKTIPDPDARFAARRAADHLVQMHGCTSAAETLSSEIGAFKSVAGVAHVTASATASASADAPPEPVKKQKTKRIMGIKIPPKQEKPPDPTLAWTAAQPSYKLSKALVGCQTPVEAAVGPKPEAAPAWAAIAKAAAIEPPQEGDSNAMVDDARTMLTALDDAPIDKVIAESKLAESGAREAAEKLQKKADTATIVQPIPEGFVPRRVALGIGIGICVIALLISYFSVRAASMRRLGTLVLQRDASRTRHPGLHAAAILRVAALHNGGEPGLVIGGALGGLVVAALFPAETDLFVAGVMIGLVAGLGLQWLYRVATRSSKWRKRSRELADIEKPTIHVGLVLNGVAPGLEAPFLRFFGDLSPEDAAQTVEKLAQQSEERILAQAEAAR
jgi:hypothetical protein